MKKGWIPSLEPINKGRCRVCTFYKFLDITIGICEDCKNKSFTIETLKENIN